MIEIVEYSGSLWYRTQWIKVTFFGETTGWNAWKKVPKVKTLKEQAP